MNKTLVGFILCVLMIGCVTTSTLKIDPLTLDGQKKSTQDGLKTISSEKNVLVTIRPATETYTAEDRPKLVLSVNSTAGSFMFSPKNIQVFVDGNPHHVFTYDELVADIKDKENKAKERAEKLKQSSYMDGGGGAMGTTGANKQYDADIYRAEVEAANALKELSATALRNIRVLPGKEYSGQITIEKIPNPVQTHEIKVIVTVNKETHEFLLNQVEVKK